MSQTEIGIIGIIVLIVLLLAGMHIGLLLVIVGFVGYGLVGGFEASLNNLAIVPFDKLNSYNFAVIPLFLLMAEFVGQGGIGKESYIAARAWLGQFKGGLAMATIGACGLFAAVCGSSLAGTIVMGRVAFPEMKLMGYNAKLASGVCAAGGTLGVLIPPSMGFVLIGILASLSIGKLFMAGILPGISVIIFYMVTIAIMCKVNPQLAPGSARTTMKEKMSAIRLTWPIFLLFFLMMGGIYGGVFTATEAAGIGAFGALIIALVKRRMTGVTFWQALMDSSKMSAMIIIMMLGAFIFNSFLAVTQIPFVVGKFLVSVPIPSYGILAGIIIFYLIAGMFFDIYAILILTIPILYPAVKDLGFDMIWYSVLMVRVIEVGFISPPFGINLFGLAGIIKEPLGVLYRGILPFCISDLINIAFLAAFPIVSTWLPGLM